MRWSVLAGVGICVAACGPATLESESGRPSDPSPPGARYEPVRQSSREDAGAAGNAGQPGTNQPGASPRDPTGDPAADAPGQVVPPGEPLDPEAPPPAAPASDLGEQPVGRIVPPAPDCNVVPGAEPLRRLTRRELAATLADLFPMLPELRSSEFVSALLPADAEQRGFDGLSTAQSASPLLAEGQWRLAERVATAFTRDPEALLGHMRCPPPPGPAPAALRLQGEAMRLERAQNAGDHAWFFMHSVGRADFDVVHAGQYRLKLRARGTPASGGWPIVSIDFDGQNFGRFAVEGDQWRDVGLPERAFTAGRHSVSITFENDTIENGQDRDFFLDYFELEGPFDPNRPSTDERLHTCAPDFLRAFVSQAWRRPVEPEAVQPILDVYTAGRPLDGAAGAVALALRAALLSPEFLFRIEVGTPVADRPGLFRLSDHELASRLSYLAWGSMPDAELRAAADRGELRTAEQVAAHADRLFADARAEVGLRTFFRQWLQLGRVDTLQRDAAVYPEFEPGDRARMADDTLATLDHLVWNEGARYEDLMTSRLAFPDARLAAVYGVAPPATPGEPVLLPEGRRAGVLTHASVLALTSKAYESSPVHRGRFVREQVLCDVMPDPPAGAMITPPAPDPSATGRERWSQHSADPACSGCHRLMDPIGFAFEHYDALGRWRDDEGGRPIDARGEVVGVDGMPAEVDGPVALAEALAETWRGPECMARQYFRFASGRVEHPTDACSIRLLTEALVAEGGSVRDMLIATTRTPAFLYRVEPEAPAEERP
ncbi:MAG: DUF1592 domain-containing protein [Bradymonadia bacterium]